MKRTLGKSNLSVSAMGFGCWAIGGSCWMGDRPVGWGQVDDRESLRAIAKGMEMGVNFFDTADVYGAGHSERVIGQAIAGKRDKVVLCTKFGNTFQEETRQKKEPNSSPEYVHQAVEASLRRLGTDYIDVYLFHLNMFPADQSEPIREELEKLVQAGKIRCYGWSTDTVDRAAAFAKGAHCSVIEHDLNLFVDNRPLLEFCQQNQLASVNRSPLAMGLLSGKYQPGKSSIQNDDLRGMHSADWIRYFRDGQPSEALLKKLESIREILRSGGRTLTQGALAWIWAKSPNTIPIPGFRTEKQITENAGAMEFGPLTQAQMAEIETLLS